MLSFLDLVLDDFKSMVDSVDTKHYVNFIPPIIESTKGCTQIQTILGKRDLLFVWSQIDCHCDFISCDSWSSVVRPVTIFYFFPTMPMKANRIRNSTRLII